MQSLVIPHKVNGTHTIFYNKKRAHACTRTSAKATNSNIINFLNFYLYGKRTERTE